MTRARFKFAGVFIGAAGFCLLSAIGAQPLAAAPQQQTTPGTSQAATERALLDKYCATCHSERLKTGGLVLEKLDTNKVGDHAENWEKIVEKLRGGMMPPPGMPRPDNAALDGLVTWAENEIDQAY